MKTLIALIVSSAVLPAQTSTATLQGTVVNASTAKPVAGAIVTAIKTGLPPLSQSARSAADGSFQILGLAAGTYNLCTQVPGGGYLNPCTWRPHSPSVTIAAGKPVTGFQLKIEAGAILGITINDPSNVLGRLGSASQSPPVSMGVYTATGLVEPSHMVSANATGSAHQITIPFDQRVQIWVHAGRLTLSQANGTPVPATGLTIPVTQSSAAGAAAPQLVFQITGSKP